MKTTTISLPIGSVLAANRLKGFGRLVSMCIVVLFSLAQTNAALAATAPNLGTAATFGILSSTYTNTVAGTTINGDLGYTTGPAATPTVNGVTYMPPAPEYSQAGADQAIALANLLSQTCTNIGPGALNLDAVDVGGGPGVFTPGCYSNGGAMNITVGQQVTLNGVGVYIFRPGGALTTEANASFVLAGGACESDVYWTPVGATTIGANTAFVGSILDPAGITIGNLSTLEGRALAFGGTVTTDVNTITVPSACAGTTSTTTSTTAPGTTSTTAPGATSTTAPGTTSTSASGTTSTSAPGTTSTSASGTTSTSALGTTTTSTPGTNTTTESTTTTTASTVYSTTSTTRRPDSVPAVGAAVIPVLAGLFGALGLFGLYRRK